MTDIKSIVYIPKYTDDTLFSLLKDRTNWQKTNFFKRNVAHYTFNIPEFNTLLIDIQQQFSRQIKGVFLNYYENGNDFAPYHADKYKMDTILLSLGTTRTLRYKHNSTKVNTDFVLNSGDLLFIPDEINNSYKHSLLKTTKISQPRISILIFLN